MNWTELLTKEVEDTYRAAEGLVRMVDEKALGWKPPTGSNWMTTGQLIQHMTDACGFCCRAFLTGDWSFMEGGGGEAPAVNEIGMPLAGSMPSAKSVKDVLAALEADRRTALESIRAAGEKDLAGRAVPAPWDPTPKPLGRQFLHMVGHLGTHKAQLFYYLKLQGRPVHTGHLYGM